MFQTGNPIASMRQPARKLRPLLTGLALLSGASHAAIVINEVDYDQPGRDTAEFIELYNDSAQVVSLDGWRIELFNGASGASYRQIDLSGQRISDYFVLCSSAGTVANCDYAFTSRDSWIQNGAPDGLALFDGATMIDSLSYEGYFAGITEGDAPIDADSNSQTVSLARLPDGFSHNDNLADFGLACITPGSANIAGSGDCSLAASVSAVPLPPAIWLFGAGLLGLVGVGRKHAPVAA